MTVPTAEAEEHYRSGFQLLTKGSYTRSRAEFYKAIEGFPDFHSAYLGLGQTFLSKPSLTCQKQRRRSAVSSNSDRKAEKGITGSVLRWNAVGNCRRYPFIQASCKTDAFRYATSRGPGRMSDWIKTFWRCRYIPASCGQTQATLW